MERRSRNMLSIMIIIFYQCEKDQGQGYVDDYTPPSLPAEWDSTMLGPVNTHVVCSLSGFSCFLSALPS